MIAVIFGIILLIFSVFACLPNTLFGLGWGDYIISVLKGATPILAISVGIFSVLIGIADIRDKREAKKDEEEALKIENEMRNAKSKRDESEKS